MKVHKTFPLEVVEKRNDGGRIVISTAGLDRDKDHVLSSGAIIDDYLKNPVVQWGHNYREPWATVGKTNELKIGKDRIEADFDLRPPANDNDPQNIVLLLWNGGWIRTASIGFYPTDYETNIVENDFGGKDYLEWELLEWSLVPIPSNQDALRLAVKAMGIDENDAGLYWDNTTTDTDVLPKPKPGKYLGVPIIISSEYSEDESKELTPEMYEADQEFEDPTEDEDIELTDAELEELADIVSDITEDLKR